MTPLRQRFIEDMLLRGLAPTTQRSYIHYVADFAKYYNLSPDKLDLEAIRQYQLYLLNEKKLSPKSVNAFVAAVQFFYQVTVEMPWGKESFSRVREGSTLPVVLSPEEVAQFFDHVPSGKYRAVLMLCYGAGLRIGEALAVKVSDIDSKRMVIRIAEGKGRKDRLALGHILRVAYPVTSRAMRLCLWVQCCRPGCVRCSVPTIERSDPEEPKTGCSPPGVRTGICPQARFHRHAGTPQSNAA
jgi:site-specific recombinase XerD